ncbi:MAG: hypothetical protein JOZ81_01955 [Chloroflexi bacterium]|nr:hypothetical protein [Chloroflexota bacterium]
MSQCKVCSAEIEWGKSSSGKPTPFDPDGKPHFASCKQPAANGTATATTAAPVAIRPATTPSVHRDLHRQVAMECASWLVAAALQSHEEARVGMVFAVADKVLKWLEADES